jgi:hypothetical protein
MIELDFISVVVGYIVGVFLTWSLTFTLYGCDNDERTEDSSQRANSGIYGWNYPYDGNTFDRRIM